MTLHPLVTGRKRSRWILCYMMYFQISADTFKVFGRNASPLQTSPPSTHMLDSVHLHQSLLKKTLSVVFLCFQAVLPVRIAVQAVRRGPLGRVSVISRAEDIMCKKQARFLISFIDVSLRIYVYLYGNDKYLCKVDLFLV